MSRTENTQKGSSKTTQAVLPTPKYHTFIHNIILLRLAAILSLLDPNCPNPAELDAFFKTLSASSSFKAPKPADVVRSPRDD
jgi:hypothetical protein